MVYRVRLEGSPEGQVFDFANYDDALNFASMAIEGGTYQNYRYENDEEGDTVKVWDDPAPLKATIGKAGVE